MVNVYKKLSRRIRANLYGKGQSEQWLLMGLATFIGIVAGYGAIGFYLGIDHLIHFVFGGSEKNLATIARELPWWHIIGALVLGGLIIGQLLRFLPEKRSSGVPHVIEAVALKNGHIPFRQGLLSAGITITSLGFGASAGREGPVVHLGATLSSGLVRWLNLSPALMRTLLGCGVAAAVAASFNAPIAGVFFALEVIIGHYALHVFTPIVISAIIGTIISRIHLGDFPAFSLPDYTISSFAEIPAFFILGIVCSVIAICFMMAMDKADKLRQRQDTIIPYWIQPAIGGLLVGSIALLYPEVLSVGYEATSNALMGSYDLKFLVALLAAKIIATVITLATRFGGGIFSPSLFIGAMTGGAFGLIAASLSPVAASDPGVYAIVGMGAVASSVLGAPISTMLIVFEITGDYSVTIAVMIASSVASMFTGMFYNKSFFFMQLANKGVHLESGRASYVLKSQKVKDHYSRDFFTIRHTDSLENARDLLIAQEGGKLIVTGQDGLLKGLVSFNQIPLSSSEIEEAKDKTIGDVCDDDPVVVYGDDPLELALQLMEGSQENILPVLETIETPVLIGIIHQSDVIQEYNKALLESQGQDR
ncbi:chloride channel protein [Temperatibacter marinus]|uniref:Chloride channel protein n=1 Tax=Temperatibacter marinus TaxID=1456591 RepID=A0AA52EDL4_9PROT|nr:chloride channel protein [Temperatibacter marinus]WND02836.1 chloride channel protein [Temperatibacter marinus]